MRAHGHVPVSCKVEMSICGTVACAWYLSRNTRRPLLAGMMQVRVDLLALASCGRASRS